MEWSAVYRYLTAKWIYGYGLPLHVLGLLGVGEGSLLALFGSGIEKTALIAVKRFGCRVVGVEIMPQLVHYAKSKAEAENMEDRLTFVNIDEEEYLRGIKPDFVFYESILSFLPNPSEVLTRYFPSAERIGVLELSWLQPDIPEDKKEYLRGIFGNEASFRYPEDWVEIFNDAGFRVMDNGFRPLGLLTKFWDDLKADQFGTLVGIFKTIYRTFIHPAARKHAFNFTSFLKRYSDVMACAYFILSPCSFQP